VGGFPTSQEFPSKDVDSFRDLCAVGFLCDIHKEMGGDVARVMKHSTVGVSAMTS
jgi:hypothetical protein